MRASVRNGRIGLVRIHNVPAFVLGNETWFWGLAFEYQRPAGMSYGRTGSLEDAKFSHRLDPKLSWNGRPLQMVPVTYWLFATEPPRWSALFCSNGGKRPSPPERGLFGLGGMGGGVGP
jgi:hypothetical protein